MPRRVDEGRVERRRLRERRKKRTRQSYADGDLQRLAEELVVKPATLRKTAQRMEYAILTRREDGRYYFLYGHDAAVSNWEAGNQCEIVFDGYLPYPTTVYGGEVEVVGDVVPGLLDHIYETRGGCGKVWHGKDERPEDDSQILIVDDDGRVRLGNTLQTVTTSLRQPAA